MTFKSEERYLERSFAYPYEAIKQMVKERVTGFPGVPTIFAILLQMEDLGRYDNCLRYITNTAQPPLEHIQDKKIFPQADSTPCMSQSAKFLISSENWTDVRALWVEDACEESGSWMKMGTAWAQES
jgi:hypothetical protein